jgi:NAD(P)-dependent dehydrogenase (short-subunit alcohol dehydrogenase family)
MKIDNACAVVTGAASGLGLATATRIVASGGRVVLFDVQAEAGALAARQLGPQASFIACDVTQEQAVEQAMQTAQHRMGCINFLVNCAGVLGAGRLLGKKGPMASAAFSNTLNINLLGTFNCDKAAAALMQHNTADDGERGVLLHTASIAAYEGQIGQVAYTATKAAVAAMTLPIARELAAFGIRCVAIAPGIFTTPMISTLSSDIQQSLAQQVPFPARLGKPEEFAQLAINVFELPMLNGTTIRLDGAIRMQPK